MKMNKNSMRYKVGRAINGLRFKSKVYEKYAPDIVVCEMVNRVRSFAEIGEPYPFSKVQEGLQYRHPFADNYNYALSEFISLCYGDW